MQQLADPAIFPEAAIGELGELYWKYLAQMEDLAGNSLPCNFDIAPDFVYEQDVNYKTGSSGN